MIAKRCAVGVLITLLWLPWTSWAADVPEKPGPESPTVKLQPLRRPTPLLAPSPWRATNGLRPARFATPSYPGSALQVDGNGTIWDATGTTPVGYWGVDSGAVMRSGGMRR